MDKLEEMQEIRKHLKELSESADRASRREEIRGYLKRLGQLRSSLDEEELKKLSRKSTAKKYVKALKKTPIPDIHSPERYVPYRLLWAKVIIRAAYDYALWKDSKDLRLKKFAQDAGKWLFEPSSLELGFESICFKFDFPIEKIRDRARNLSKDDVKKLEFRERHGRDPLDEIDNLTLESMGFEDGDGE